MTDFAAFVHLRIMESAPDASEFRGGFGWFLGRFDTIEEFYARLETELTDLHYRVEEYEKIFEVDSVEDLSCDEQRELFENLDLYPVQYRTIHRYRNDDS